MNNSLKELQKNKKAFLSHLLREFHDQNLQIKIGIELEFYLQDQNNFVNQNQVLEFIERLKPEIIRNNIDLLQIEPEQGQGQIEIKTIPYLDVIKLCEDIEKIKEITQTLNPDLQINFASVPNQKDCGNSTQINFSLIKNNQYLFAKDEKTESDYLLWSIAGILENTKKIMIAFAPNEEDFQRFEINFNRNLHKIKKYPSPTNISWGYDNRSALVRIPRTQKMEERRLEYRLGGSTADIYMMCACFLSAILDGIEKKKYPIKEIYGNAFDEQYSYLESLPSFDNAKEFFRKFTFKI